MAVVAREKGGARPLLQPYLGLAIGVLGVSSAAILIRLADAPALVIGTYRLGLASLILTPFALTIGRQELQRLGRRDLGLAVVSGFFLGIHFAAWITSLEYTTVASSVVLVTTTPLFVGLASHFWMRERVSGVMWLGIVISVFGAATIGWGDLGITPDALWGDLLALLGALCGSAYFLLGRQLRSRLSLLTYIYPTYWTAALVLSLAAWIGGNRFLGYPGRTYLMFLLLALVPQIVGHSMINWSLKHLSPALVTVSILGEPIMSTILAYFVLAEMPSGIKMIGALLVLTGIYIATRGERKR